MPLLNRQSAVHVDVVAVEVVPAASHPVSAYIRNRGATVHWGRGGSAIWEVGRRDITSSSKNHKFILTDTTTR